MDFALNLVLAVVIGAAFIAVGLQNLLYPRSMTRDAVDYARNNARGPAKKLVRPFTRLLESQPIVLLQRLTGIVFVLLGVVVFCALVWFTVI